MLSSDQLKDLRGLLQERQIGAGISLLETCLPQVEELPAGEPNSGVALGTLAQWVDVGYDGGDLLERLLKRFSSDKRSCLPLNDYIQLRMAEAVAAMRREELPEALDHLRAVLVLEKDLSDAWIAVTAGLWKAHCLRKAGEYEHALEVTRESMKLAESQGFLHLAALLRTLESWMIFQRGESKEAIRILQEAKAVLRDTDDFITLGNIQSAYGRIARREGRYEHAMQYFEASIEMFRKRLSLEGYLARSLTNIAQAKRFLALQPRRGIDASHERQRLSKQSNLLDHRKDKAGQLERMYDLFNNTEKARACCDQAETYLNNDRHDALWQEVEILRSRILHAGLEDPNLRAWSQGAVGDKSLQQVVADFEEVLIRRVLLEMGPA